MLPRHQAGSAELVGGTGPITAMCSLGSHLEIYKRDKTFHVRTPESVDPEETNPNAPWVTSAVADVGSSSLSVARVLLQSRDMLESALLSGDIDKAAVILALHSCKESLVACEQLAEAVVGRIEGIVESITSSGIPRDNQGRGLNPFPQVASLDFDCGMFLVHANRAIKAICEMPLLFFPLTRRDSNFEHLARRLRAEAGEAQALAEFVEANVGGVKYLIALRNFHEHPGATRTVIRNFHVLPEGSVAPPCWYLEGEETSEPYAIAASLPATVSFLRDMAEAMFIHLLMARVQPNLPFFIEKIPERSIDPSLPIRYRLSIDLARLQAGTADGNV
jgi:hypothetical protein